MDTTAEPCCVVCTRALHATEATRWACTGCQQQAATQLAALPGLYAALGEVLIPGRGIPTVGSRGAFGSRPPADLDVMDLTDGTRGGVIAVLVSCVRDWAETGDHQVPDWPPGEQARVRVLCDWLRFRLDWACGEHPGVGDSLRDIADVHRHVRGRATGERGERPVRLACPCGGVILWRLSGPAYRCPGCGARYGREEAAALPQARRTVAA
ncbi:hypothetical protein ACTWP5_27475 [Streptomyces sp. 4N509B]|uniref:hypothetical protein n=1 Tax=Streptomyces sp. 4N509B TaxID=3457413 RepID=UPI003FD5921C